LDVHEPDFAPKIEVVANMFQTVLALDAGNADTSESLAKSFADRVARWDVDPGNAPEVFTTIAKALRRGGVKAPIALVVNDARNVGTLFEAGIGQFVSAIVFRGAWPSANDLMAFRFAVERTGYEGIPILGAISGGQPQDTGIGVRIARQILTNLAKGVTPTEVDSALIYGEDLGDSYVYLGGLAQRLTGCAPVGEMDLVEGVQAFVFRAGPRWIIAFWTTHAPREVSVKVENASDLALFDARDNPLPAPSLKNGTVSVHVAAEPQFLIGKAGSVIYQAARTTARRHAAVFAGSEDFRTHLPPELLEVVRKFAAAESPGYTRMDFLDLLRIFPRIEELWHTGAVPRSVAVPALAALSRLARTLCVVEQERGEPFLEPLQKTLANCGQFQSLYLTSSAGASEVRERPDWILDEVGRLMTQAEQLGTEGRPIEACGMAALAEWRARALELAAKAQPLSLPEKAVAPAVVPAPQKPEKATTKKASSKTATPKAADQETATPRKEKEPAKTKSKKTTKDKK
jgi:hypothetical protein